MCLMDFGPEDVVAYFRWLHKSAQEHFRIQEKGHLAIIGQQQMLWLRVLLCVSLMHEESLLSDDEVTAFGSLLEIWIMVGHSAGSRR
ncbi:hypothetical protein TRAPUB_5415 [Trametes pubescens]|uniref:Uncharacterized protein n=1 Tax=Trametes pubescens TaxID=154538 RepID=A0A1M2V8K8_TRAPU|nr:hypothetical protein TRAPUB_5415 [Trametes pubescens]